MGDNTPNGTNYGCTLHQLIYHGKMYPDDTPWVMYHHIKPQLYVGDNLK